MIIIEVKKNIFLNFDNVFRMDIIHKEDEPEVYWRFYSNEEFFCSSKEFPDEIEAYSWLSTQIARAQGSNEIIFL